MSNALTDTRDRLKTALAEAGLTAHVTVPERVTPPLAFVAPGEPYLTPEGATFGGEILRHEIVVVARAGVNDKKAADLDALIVTAVDALQTVEDQVVEEVSRPGQISLGGQAFLATTIHVKTEIHRG